MSKNNSYLMNHPGLVKMAKEISSGDPRNLSFGKDFESYPSSSSRAAAPSVPYESPAQKEANREQAFSRAENILSNLKAHIRGNRIVDVHGNLIFNIRDNQLIDVHGRTHYHIRGDRIDNVHGNLVFHIRDGNLVDVHGKVHYKLK